MLDSIYHMPLKQIFEIAIFGVKTLRFCHSPHFNALLNSVNL